MPRLQSARFPFSVSICLPLLAGLALNARPLARTAVQLYLRVMYTHPVWLSWALFMLVFHVTGAVFEYSDRRRLFYKYKQFKPLPTSPLYTHMLPTVVFNQVFILLPIMHAAHHVGWVMTVAVDASSTYANAARSYFLLATVAPLLHEFFFYFAHRFVLHSRWGFSVLNHGLHHSSRAHCSISAMYMAPIDFVLEVVIPYIMPMIFLSKVAHSLPRSHAIWMLPIGTLGGMYEHSGYNFFPGVKGLDTAIHGRHHTMHSCSFSDGFGSPSLLDHWLCTACAPIPSYGLSRTVEQYTSKRAARRNGYGK